MSLTLFLALCIAGVDFLIYALFQWTYGDKRKALEQKLAAHQKARMQQELRPFVVRGQKAGPETQRRLQLIRERMDRNKRREIRPGEYFGKRLA